MCNVSWVPYNDHLRQMLQELKSDENSKDVTLVCDDKLMLNAHKIVLKACSPVFSSILDRLPQANTIIYLKGIHHQELESMLHFMYFGETTFLEGRISEFLDIAKNLEIKELKDLNQEDFKKEFEKDTDIEDNTNKSLSKNKYDNLQTRTCPDCGKVSGSKADNLDHYRSIHKGIKHPCDQCDFVSKWKKYLRHHIQSKHKGNNLPCDKCDYKAPKKSTSIAHQRAKHDGNLYSCSLCDFKSRTRTNLARHLDVKHLQL